MTIKDWLTVAMSAIALVVSLVTAFFNVLLQFDDLRVVFGSSPMVIIDEKGQLVVGGDQELTFINSGNRAAAITRIGGIARRMRQADDRSCQDTELLGAPIAVEAQAFVLKPGEIFNVKVTPDLPFMGKKDKDGTIVVPKGAFPLKEGDKFFACIALNIVTPDSYSARWRNPAFEFEVVKIPGRGPGGPGD